MHQSDEPLRTTNEAINCKTIEMHPTSLAVSKDMRPLNSHLIASDDYDPIDVNEFMEGLHSMARYKFLEKVKACLLVPFQLWSWKISGSSGVSTHFVWKIIPKATRY